MLSTFQVLQQISKYWDQMTTSEQTALATSLAGKTRFDVFTAVMNRFGDAVSATDAALNSQGVAASVNEKYMESLKAKLAALNQQFQELVIGNGGTDSFSISLVNLGVNALKLINDIGGLPTVIGAISSAILILNGQSIGKGLVSLVQNFDSIGTSLKSLKNLFPSVTAAWTAYKTAQVSAAETAEATAAAEVALNSAVSATIPIIGLVILAYTAISAVVNAYNEGIKKSQEAQAQSVSDTENQITTLKSVTEQLKSETLTRDQLNQIVANNIQSYGDEIGKITDLNKARQVATDKVNEQIKAQANLLVATGQTSYESAESNISNSKSSYKMSGDLASYYTSTGDVASGEDNPILSSEYSDVSVAKGYDKQISSLEKLKNTLNSIRNEYATGSSEYKTYNSEMSRTEAEIANVNAAFVKDKGTVDSFNNALQTAGYRYDATTKLVATSTKLVATSTKLVATSTDKVSDAIQDYEDSLSDATDDSSDASDAEKTLAEALGTTTSKLESAANAAGMTVAEYAKFIQSNSLSVTELSALAKQAGISEEALLSLSDSMGLNVKQTAEYEAGITDFKEGLESVQSVYSTLSSAVKEYNENNGYTTDTIEKLMALDPSYLTLLQDEGGQLTVNTQALKDKVTALVAQDKQVIYDTAINKLNAIAAKGAGTAATDASKDHKDAVDGITKESDALNRNTEEKLSNAQANAIAKGGTNASAEVAAVMAQMKSEYGALDSFVKGITSDFSGSMAKSSKSASKSSTDTWKAAYETQQKILSSEVKTGEITQQQYYSDMSVLIEKYYGVASGKHTKYIQEYKDAESSLYSDMESVVKDNVSTVEDAYSTVISNLKDQESKEADAIEKQIDAVKKKEDSLTTSIENQIDAVKDQKSATDDYYDGLITQLQDANTASETAIKLEQYQEALDAAKAKKTMVLGTSGKFEYGQDEASVTTAQENLSSYQSESAYNAKLKSLQDYKKAADDSYDQQVSDLEDYEKSVKANYDQQVTDLQDHEANVKAQYEAQITNYQTLLDTFKTQSQLLLNDQATTANGELTTWQQRLQNVMDFVNQYNATLAQLGKAGKTVSITTVSKTVTAATASAAKTTTATKKATGDASINSDGIYLVGDSPNTELVIGNKINGSLMSLKNDDGVVNAKSTKTFAGLLNMLTPSAISGSVGSTVSNSKSTANNFTFSGNIVLPSVSDATSFVSGLKSYSQGMLQSAFSNQ